MSSQHRFLTINYFDGSLNELPRGLANIELSVTVPITPSLTRDIEEFIHNRVTGGRRRINKLEEHSVEPLAAPTSSLSQLAAENTRNLLSDKPVTLAPLKDDVERRKQALREQLLFDTETYTIELNDEESK